jgi:Na+-translocating ferredoxin:NAD+ oxidoreductase RnfD subunit
MSFVLKLRSIKSQLIVYLTCFAIFLSIRDKDAAFLIMALIAVVSALAVESIVLYVKTKAFRVTESSIITGLIVGYVLSSDQAWWMFVFASSLAILSKYVMRVHKKHIFNPAAMGIFFALIFLNASTQWKGTYAWYMLAPFGFYFAYKIRKIEIIIGYTIVSLALFGAQAALQNVPLSHIFGYFSYFYIFVMVIEPKTTPIRPIGKFLFGAGVAGLIFVLTQRGARFDVELFSLLVFNITAQLLDKIPYRKAGAA